MSLRQIADCAIKHSNECIATYNRALMAVRHDEHEAARMSADLHDRSVACDRLINELHRLVVSAGGVVARRIQMAQRHKYNRRVLAGHQDRPLTQIAVARHNTTADSAHKRIKTATEAMVDYILAAIDIGKHADTP